MQENKTINIHENSKQFLILAKILNYNKDLIWIKHNFADKHFTTKEIPAVELGIVDNGFSFEELFYLRITA